MQLILIKPYFLFIGLFAFIGCNKFVETEVPVTNVVKEIVFLDDRSAQSAMRGVYSYLSETGGLFLGGSYGMSALGGLTADELKDFSGFYKSYETNTILPTDEFNLKFGLWDQAYKLIYFSNAILEGVNASSTIAEITKRQLEGESKFIRAISLFYLVNLFGDIPVPLTTGYELNNALLRSDVNEVYKQILQDLSTAEELLPEDYSASNGEKVQPNKAAAIAMLARAYLYLGAWENAEIKATDALALGFTLENDPDNVFLKNSSEAIWQIPAVSAYMTNTADGSFFLPFADASSFYAPESVALRDELLSAFEPDDLRREKWSYGLVSLADDLTYYFPYKYKIKYSDAPATEYNMIMRSAELYLIRAEARAQQNNLSGANGADADLNMIRTRAGLNNVFPSNKADILAAVAQERRVEFFAELGHRWFDLKRTQQADPVLSVIKGAGWQISDTLYPIPQTDRNNNPQLTQNAGY